VHPLITQMFLAPGYSWTENPCSLGKNSRAQAVHVHVNVYVHVYVIVDVDVDLNGFSLLVAAMPHPLSRKESADK